MSCGTLSVSTPRNLGSHVTVTKTLNGEFINRDGHLLLLSGTEARSTTNCQAFLYDIDEEAMLFSSSLDGAV